MVLEKLLRYGVEAEEVRLWRQPRQQGRSPGQDVDGSTECQDRSEYGKLSEFPPCLHKRLRTFRAATDLTTSDSDQTTTVDHNTDAMAPKNTTKSVKGMCDKLEDIVRSEDHNLLSSASRRVSILTECEDTANLSSTTGAQKPSKPSAKANAAAKATLRGVSTTKLP